MKKIILTLAVAVAFAATTINASAVLDLKKGFDQQKTNVEIIKYFEENISKLEALTQDEKNKNKLEVNDMIAIYGYALMYEKRAEEALKVFSDVDCVGANCKAGLGSVYHDLGDCSLSYQSFKEGFLGGWYTYFTVLDFYDLLMDGKCVIYTDPLVKKLAYDPVARYLESVRALNECVKYSAEKDAKDCERLLKENNEVINSVPIQKYIK